MACFNDTSAVDFRMNAAITVIKHLRSNESCHQYLVGNDSTWGIGWDHIYHFFNPTGLDLLGWLGPWAAYEAKDVFSRLIDFKLPLLQLISQTPRPRLGSGWYAFWIQVFAIAHLCGDPIDTMSGYLFTMWTCRDTYDKILAIVRKREAERRMVEWRHIPKDERERIERRCRRMTLVHMSYAAAGRCQTLRSVVA